MQSAIGANGYDFHCHLDLYKNRAEVQRDIETAQIVTLAMTTTPRSYEPNIALFGKSEYVRIGLGLHPELAATREANVELFESFVGRAQVIGEIGLDGRPQYAQTLPVQKDLLHRILRMSASGPAKLFSFHSVRAVTDVLDIIETYLSGPTHVKVLHWFTGSKKELLRAIDLGCYFSVNLAMCRKSGVLQLLALIPDELLITETDGPFVKNQEQPLHPSYVLELNGILGELLDCSVDAVRARIKRNSLRALAAMGIG